MDMLKNKSLFYTVLLITLFVLSCNAHPIHKWKHAKTRRTDTNKFPQQTFQLDTNFVGDIAEGNKKLKADSANIHEFTAKPQLDKSSNFADNIDEGRKHFNSEPTSIHDLYELLNLACQTLFTDETRLYQDYKATRFGNSDIIIPPLPMDGLPQASDLPPPKRLNMTEEELLSVHRQNLIAFKGAVEQVYLDEKNSTDPISFLPALLNSMEYTQFALTRLDVLMYELNITSIPQPSEPVLFEPEPREAVRNIRDLYVLQEMNLYLPIPLSDFPRLQKSHEATPSPPTTKSPPSLDVYEEYGLLIEETSVLSKYAGKVLEEYQMDRNGGYICEFVDIPGMPDRAGLSFAERIQMTEEELLQTHRSNIYTYKEAVGHVLVDEQLSNSPNDFTVDFETLQLMKQRVLNREESVMAILDFTIDLPPTGEVSLKPEDNEAIRNQRDCHILQELTLYLPMCLQDFPRLQTKHSEAHPVEIQQN